MCKHPLVAYYLTLFISVIAIKIVLKMEKRRDIFYYTYFQHDNARPHIAKVVKAKLDEFGWKVLPHPPCSYDFAPSDYHLFRSMSNALKKKIFKNETELKSSFKTFLTLIPSLLR